MIQEVAQYLQNKENTLNQGRSGLCEILGSQHVVEELAAIWKKSKAELKLARAAMILDFCNYQDFSKQDIFYFKLGLESTFKLLSDCAADVDAKVMLEKNAAEKKAKNQT